MVMVLLSLTTNFVVVMRGKVPFQLHARKVVTMMTRSSNGGKRKKRVSTSKIFLSIPRVVCSVASVHITIRTFKNNLISLLKTIIFIITWLWPKKVILID